MAHGLGDCRPERPVDSRRVRFLAGAWAGMFALVLLAASEAESTVVRWKQIGGGPGARDFAAAAYGDGKILVFGGRDLSASPMGMSLGDTWLWNGAVWKQISAGNPSPRFGAAMAYDENMKVFVLSGGRTSGGLLPASTYHFDPSTEAWSGPLGLGGPQRDFHALAYDPIAQKVMLFGGTSTGGAFPTDVFSWDGTSWSVVSTTGGGGLGRTRHGLAYDSSQGGLVLHGGNVGGFILDDAWILKAGNWTQLSAAWTGMGQQGHGLVYDPNQSRVTIYAGRATAAVLDDTRLSSAATTLQVFPVPNLDPSARSGLAMVYDQARKLAVVIGGSNNSGAPQADANWEFFMTGQACTSNDQCKTNVCATGVCCLIPCDPPCRDCDRVNTMLDPEVIDGECHPVTGMDPRFCVFDPGCRGTCSEVATCVYPGRDTPCGLCLACNDQNGKCDQMPLSEDDPDCETLANKPFRSCDAANVKCRTYADPQPLRRCIALGQCGWRWSDCTNYLSNSCNECK